MARANKYSSINFNDIYEKKTKTNSSSGPHPVSSSPSNKKTIISNSRIHGHMLVLSRPTPKPITVPQPTIQQQPKLESPKDQVKVVEPEDSISVRPQGGTGFGSGSGSGSGSGPTDTSSSPLQSPLQKSNRFVPPHLRPGFVGREEKPAQPGLGVRGRTDSGPGDIGSPPRPKSGGGYERMRRGFGEADSGNFMNRPSSRPSSSG